MAFMSDVLRWLLVGLAVLAGGIEATSQCLVADFTVLDTVCPDAAIVPTNNSTAGLTYVWDACAGDLQQTPTITNLGALQSAFSNPRSISIGYDGNEWYGFIKNIGGGGLINCIRFGNDLSNPPTDTSYVLGTGLNSVLGQIRFREEGGNWYGLTTNLGGNLLRLDFGNSLGNVPTLVDLGDFNGLSVAAASLQIKQWGDTVFTILTNHNTNTLTVVQQTQSILAPVDTFYNVSIPTAIVNGATNIELVRDSCGWVGFTGLQFNSRLLRIDFGSSLTNTPVGTDFSNLLGTINTPINVAVAQDGDQRYLFVRNRFAGVTKINFGDSYRNPIQSSTSLGNFGGVLSGSNDWMDYAKFGSRHYVFTGNGSNNLLRIDFPDTCLNSPATVTGFAPAIVIGNPGTTILEMAAIDSNGNAVYAVDTLVQTAGPDAQFAVNNLCADQNSAFTDGSVPGSGTLNYWKWQFGDGDSSSLTDPIHLYLNPGAYTLSLEVGNSFGCRDTATQNLQLQFSPTAAFSGAPACEGDTVVLQNTSAIGGGSISTYAWTDVEGNQFSGVNPAITFDTAGNLPLQLIVTSDSGCIDSVTNVLSSLARPAAQFSVERGCEGDTTLLLNQTTLDGSATIAGYSWELGDLTTSTSVSPEHLYADTGNYLVTFVATSNNGCADSIASLIRIANRPDPDFSIMPDLVCLGDSIQFNDSTVAAIDTLTGWNWNFGTGDSSLLQNPLMSFDTAGVFPVTLTATVGSGCDSSITKSFEVRPLPVPAFSVANRCLNSGTLFTDISTVASGDSIVGWNWNFGDAQSDTAQNPMNNYLQSGDYAVSLELTTALGCSAVDSVPVYIFGLPTVAFSNSFLCSGIPADFFDQAVADSGDALNTWRWQFDNLVSGSSDTLFGPFTTVTFDTGVVHVVTLTVISDEGCENSAQSTLTVNQSPTAGFDFLQACDGEATQFVNESTGNNLNYLWDFNIGLNSTLENPAFLFDSSGTYPVRLITFDVGTTCSDTVSLPVSVFPSPVANIATTNSSTACLGIPMMFADSSFVLGDSITQVQWTVFRGDTFVGPEATITFNDTALQLVSLLVTTSNGCQDSTSQTVSVSPLPTSDFTFSPEFGVPPLDVSFTNLSTGGNSYNWNFGDGNQANGLAPLYQYTDTGIFDIQLIVTNAFGCQDSNSRIIKVIQPVLDIAVTNLKTQVQNGFYTLNADLSNLGTREITTVDLLIEPANGSRIREQWVGSLASGEQINYTFAASFALVDGETPVYACVTAVDPNGETDDVPENNRQCALEVSTLSLVKPFPNPATDQVTLSLFLPFRETVEVRVYNQLGQLKTIVFEGSLSEGRTDLLLPLADYAGGTYHFAVYYRDQVEVLPFVKVE